MDDCYLVLTQKCHSKEIFPIPWLNGYCDENLNVIVPKSAYSDFCETLFYCIGKNLLDDLDIPSPLGYYTDCLLEAFVEDYAKNGNPYDFVGGDEIRADEIRQFAPDAKLDEDVYFLFLDTGDYLDELLRGRVM